MNFIVRLTDMIASLKSLFFEIGEKITVCEEWSGKKCTY